MQGRFQASLNNTLIFLYFPFGLSPSRHHGASVGGACLRGVPLSMS